MFMALIEGSVVFLKFECYVALKKIVVRGMDIFSHDVLPEASHLLHLITDPSR